VDIETIKQIWEMMLSFDGRSFCKPHSASCAMVSFQSTWLRVHYPAGFMAAKGLSKTGIGTIVKERDRIGDFSSLEDFTGRIRMVP
jgi:DNA polymerase III alpha subunit